MSYIYSDANDASDKFDATATHCNIFSGDSLNAIPLKVV